MRDFFERTLQSCYLRAYLNARYANISDTFVDKRLAFVPLVFVRKAGGFDTRGIGAGGFVVGGMSG